MADYFYAVSGAFAKTASSGGIDAQSADGGAVLQFINPVLADGFYLSFLVPDAALGNTDRVTVTLYDSADRTISIRLEIFRNTQDMSASGKSLLSINGGEKKDFTGNFYSSLAPIGLRYKAKTHAIADTNGTLIGYADETESGAPFEGFPSGKVWFEVDYGAVTGAGLRLRFLNANNQPLSDGDGDFIVPELSLAGHLPLQAAAGQLFAIPAAVGQDILVPRAAATVSVFNAAGERIVNGVSADIPNECVLPSPGVYKVAYRVEPFDGSRAFSQEIVVRAVEYDPPELAVDGSPPERVKVGDTVALPAARASDGTTAAPAVFIFLIRPDCDMRALGGDREFTADAPGRYVARYCAYDEFFNYTVKEFVIIAEQR
jgi:hypothetical protein